MGFTVLIIATIVALIFYTIAGRFYRFYLFYQRFNKIPGPEYAIPFFGVAFKFLPIRKEDRINWFKNLTNQYKDGLFRAWMGMTPVVYLHKPEHIEKILQSSTEITKAPVYEFLEPWVGQGLLTSTGSQWVHNRKMLTPAFHFSILEVFTEVMIDKTVILNSCIERAIKIHGDKPFDVRELGMRCALDIICETAMGTNIRAPESSYLYTVKDEYREAIKVISEAALNRLYRPWLRPDCIFYNTALGKSFKAAVDFVGDYCIRIIVRKQEERKSGVTVSKVSAKKSIMGNSKKRAFLDLLLEANEEEDNPMTIEEIKNEANTFMFAGHDTIGSLIGWALFCLGNEPDVQRKVHEELDDVLGDSDNAATLKALPNLRYLERVIKEVLRLYPSVVAIGRCLQKDMQIDDYTIPGGTCVIIQILHLHRDSAIWQNPLRFDPDRFLPENIKTQHPYSYVPFSAGMRNCIGKKFAMLEAKIVLAQILRNFSVKSIETHSTIKMFSDIVLTPVDGIYVNMTRRRTKV